MRSVRVATRLGVIAAVALAAPAHSRAQDFFEELFGGFAPQPHRSEGAATHRSERWRPTARPSAPRRHITDRSPKHAARPNFDRNRNAGADSEAVAGPSSGGGYCVRMCDGYFFPLIKSELATKLESCEYACPSAKVDIYQGATIETARNFKGQSYASIPTAFKFREMTTSGCSCNMPEQSQAVFLHMLRSDPTLRKGDIAFEEDGVYVYDGSRLNHAGNLSRLPRGLREKLKALLPVSRLPLHSGTPAASPSGSIAGIARQEQQSRPRPSLAGGTTPMNVRPGDNPEANASLPTPALLIVLALAVAAVGATKLDMAPSRSAAEKRPGSRAGPVSGGSRRNAAEK